MGHAVGHPMTEAHVGDEVMNSVRQHGVVEGSPISIVGRDWWVGIAECRYSQAKKQEAEQEKEPHKGRVGRYASPEQGY